MNGAIDVPEGSAPASFTGAGGRSYIPQAIGRMAIIHICHANYQDKIKYLDHLLSCLLLGHSMHRGGYGAINFNIAITVMVRIVGMSAKQKKKKDLQLSDFILVKNKVEYLTNK